VRILIGPAIIGVAAAALTGVLRAYPDTVAAIPTPVLMFLAGLTVWCVAVAVRRV